MDLFSNESNTNLKKSEVSSDAVLKLLEHSIDIAMEYDKTVMIVVTNDCFECRNIIKIADYKIDQNRLYLTDETNQNYELHINLTDGNFHFETEEIFVYSCDNDKIYLGF